MYKVWEYVLVFWVFFFTCDCPITLAPFVEKILFLPLNCLPLSQKQLAIYSEKNWKQVPKPVHVHVCTKQHYHNSQKVERAQMSIIWWMDKPNMVYTHNGILFSHKKGMKYWHMLKVNEHWNMLSERSQIQKITYYVIPIIWSILNR